jgi:hypothetical protein
MMKPPIQLALTVGVAIGVYVLGAALNGEAAALIEHGAVGKYSGGEIRDGEECLPTGTYCDTCSPGSPSGS